MSRSRSPMAAWVPPSLGDRFVITGPQKRDGSGCWTPGSSGWQPRAWTSVIDDPASRPVRRDECNIDFSAIFTVEEVHPANRFFQVRVTFGGHSFWLNAAKTSRGSPELRPWIRVLPP